MNQTEKLVRIVRALESEFFRLPTIDDKELRAVIVGKLYEHAERLDLKIRHEWDSETGKLCVGLTEIEVDQIQWFVVPEDMSYQYITIEPIGRSKSGKTLILEVRAKSNRALLGRISWHGVWRQYTFWPEPNCIFSAGCLVDITNELRDLQKRKRDAT